MFLDTVLIKTIFFPKLLLFSMQFNDLALKDLLLEHYNLLQHIFLLLLLYFYNFFLCFRVNILGVKQNKTTELCVIGCGIKMEK